MKTSLIPLAVLLILAQAVSAQWLPVNGFNFSLQTGKLYALSEDTIIVAGNNGNIYFSADAGQNFSKDSLPFPHSWFLDIDFPSDKVGYVCGGTAFGPVKSPIAKTLDGGQTWDSISGNAYGYQLTAVSFVDENTGYFAGQNIIVKTQDGGQTFSVDTLPMTWITDLVFLDVSTGFYMSERSIFRTLDGGQNWNVVFTDTNQNIFPVGGIKLDFVSTQVGYALNQGLELVKTTDGGATWNYFMDPADSLRFVDFDFVDTDTGYAISFELVNGNSHSSIYKTVDGGLSWGQQYVDSAQNLRYISMVTTNAGYALGDSLLVATQNGGIGLPEAGSRQEFNIYPNPATQFFTFNLPADFKTEEIQIMDMTGRIVRNYSRISDTQSVSVELLKAGIYFVLLKTSKGMLVEKLMVRKK